jgi:hypothetical protein
VAVDFGGRAFLSAQEPLGAPRPIDPSSRFSRIRDERRSTVAREAILIASAPLSFYAD